MPRASRIVIPDLPHHVIQRGNRRQAIFHSDDDYRGYRDLIALYAMKTGTRCLAWCLMPNHIHLVLVPPTPDGLRATLAGAHTAYAQRINAANDWVGHLFQGRYASYPMDQSHLMIAARYIENNPVKAGLVKRAQDWRWSSARAHIEDRDDGLTDRAALGEHIANWAAMLMRGLEASDEHVESALRSGTPLGSPEWRSDLARTLGRPLGPAKRGPKPRTPI